MVQNAGELHRAVVEALNPGAKADVLAGDFVRRRKDARVFIPDDRRPWENRFGGFVGVKFLEDLGQVVIHLERERQLVEADVGPVAARGVFLEFFVILRKCFASVANLRLQGLPFSRRVLEGRFELHDHLEQVDRRPELAEFVDKRQVARVEGVKAEHRPAHEGEHHAHDQAQSRDQFDANGPLWHGVDLLVAVTKSHRGEFQLARTRP